MRINRQDLLQQLESVTPGLTTRDVTEQSSCFVFMDGHVVTFNDEVSCKHKTKLTGIQGAVPSKPLLGVLRKMPEDELDISEKDGEFLIVGKNRSSGITMDSEISLPIHLVEAPDKWSPLHSEFGEAVQLAQQCASRDMSTFVLTCINITPKYVEASDNYQIIRYRLKTGVPEPTLIRRDSLKHIVDLGMTKFCMTESWAHFKNANGLIFSCRRSSEAYSDGTEILKQSGALMTLPKGLGEAVELSKEFTSDTVDEDGDQVLVELWPGKLRIRGEGALGWFKERKKIKYDGDPLSFRISPALLMDLSNRHNECEVSADMLKVNGGKFTYVTCLGVAEEEGEAEVEPAPKTKRKRSGEA